MKFRNTLLVLSFALFSVVAAAQQVEQSNTASKNILADNYRIGVGDVIDVVVSQNETLSKTGVRVTNQGGIQLPMLDTDIPAACLTERELADRVRDKYKKYLLEPYVNVTVREFNASPIAFIGAVNSPGRFQLQRPVRLLELLTFVSGTRENAGDTIRIVRNRRMPYCEESKLVIPAEMDDELLSISLNETLQGTNGNLYVKAGDIISIDQADEKVAYLIGNVRSALTLKLKEPVTLTQAIAMAGGLSEGADITKIKIKRRAAGSLTPTAQIINLKDINQRKREDVLIEPNDIIEVPGPSGGKKILRDIMKTLVPSITQLPMRVVTY